MFTVHYIIDAPIYDCKLALNDAQAERFFDVHHGKTDGYVAIVNEVAFEALRVAIAEDKFDREQVEVVIEIDGVKTKHKFNTFGVLLDEHGRNGYHRYQSAFDRLQERRGYAIAAKQRVRKQEREAQLKADREARLSESLPEPWLSVAKAADAEARATVDTYLAKVADGAQAGLQALCGDGPDFEVHQKL